MSAERQPHPFASARDGRIATGDGPNVVVWDAATHTPIWTHRVSDPPGLASAALDSFRSAAELEPRVVGLQWVDTSLLAVDDRGRLVRLSPTGDRLETVECGVAAFALLATDYGLWAVLHPRGAALGRTGDRRLRHFQETEVSCGTFADDGNFLALGTRDGRLVVSPLDVAGVREVVVGSTLYGVVWQPRFGWAVACEDAIVRIDSSYAEVERWWVDASEGSERSERPGLTGLVAGIGLCAWWRGPSEVVVVALRTGMRLATLALGELGELEGGELELGPWPWLGFARRGGGYDRVDLRTGRVEQHDASTAMVRVDLDHEVGQQLVRPTDPGERSRLWSRIAVTVLFLTMAMVCVCTVSVL